MDNTLQLTNALREDVERMPSKGIPIDIFPETVQKLVLDLHKYENFNIEYVMSIILSAVGTAIGNSCHLRVKGEWKVSPCLYMMLVGRPGTGKTPPLKFLYRPINERDDLFYQQYRSEYDEYESQLKSRAENADAELDCHKPKLVTTVISDFTPEAMCSAHQNNSRGIALVVDEIISMFDSVHRYSSKNNLIETLLSAYSGYPLKIIRKSKECPIVVKSPCINVIGTIQVDLLSEVFKPEFFANGLMDRFIIVYPKDQSIPKWKRGHGFQTRPDIIGAWRQILRRILDIPCLEDESHLGVMTKVMEFTPDAEALFYEWNNGIIDGVNAIEDDCNVDSRMMKLNGNAARLSLVIQILRWACSEAEMDRVDLVSVKSAIRLMEYFEESYRRAQGVMSIGPANEPSDALLSMLGDSFTASAAIEAGKQLGVSRRTVYNMLSRMCNGPEKSICKKGQGKYEKIPADDSPADSSAHCTIALSGTDAAVSKGQSAVVQSATTKIS